MSDAQGNPQQQPQQAQQQQATFQIEKVYVKDLSLEIPNAPKVFLEQVQPQLEVRIDSAAQTFAEGYYEVVVTATVTAKIGERTLFLVEAAQAAIFAVRNVPAEELDPLLGIACPNVIFPYLRETISDVVVRGGFPPVLLAPLSFEALYMQRMQQQQQGQASGAQGPGGPNIQIARS
ncbi:MAG TPA: protein-export chaperone SecB [Burkholderiales bacterium]|nr:protein-export chaperone SecB [Burkholderiales bacterium]